MISENDGLEKRVVELELQIKTANLMRDLNGHMHVCRSFEDASTLMNLYLPQLFPDAGGAVFLIDRETGQMQPATIWGLDREIEAFDPQACFAMQAHEEYHYRLDGGLEVCVPIDPKSNCSLYPMLDEDRPIGLLMIEPFDDIPADSEAFEKIVTRGREVGQQLSFSVASVYMRDKLRQQTVRDPLTGLSNRRFLEESLEREEARSRREGTPVSIVMIDIDHFRDFNTQRGHIAGDAVLVKLGEVLRNHCRSGDIACRYGGEEFTMIFPGMDMKIAEQRAETIRQAVEASEVYFQGTKLPQVTASFGIATYPDHGDKMNDVVARADEALYQAKEEGRNRVILAKV